MFSRFCANRYGFADETGVMPFCQIGLELTGQRLDPTYPSFIEFAVERLAPIVLSDRRCIAQLWGERLGIGIRYFLFPEGDEPLKLSQRLVQGLVDGNDALPQFAGTRQKILHVVLDTENGDPTNIVRYEASVWAFDKDGTIVESLRESFAEIMSFAFPASPPGNVVSLNPKIKKRRHEERHRWNPTDDELGRAAADIWRKPGVKSLKSAKGVSKRTPPLTYEARHALNEMREHFFKIEHPFWNLSERALKGLAHEARKRAEEGDYAELFLAVAEIAERKLRLITRRKSAKGTWYALVEVSERARDGVETVVATYHRKCDGKDAAEVAGRDLLDVHSNKISADRTVLAVIETDLEWDAAGRWSTES
ncbi:hypothetical protein JP74_22035 [Devosia sp. 17-2-E-8]|nr:hypothetical protein JP74_22035 [Devosia sp. 17-2-E-8]